MRRAPLLVADIGGTHARFALAAPSGKAPALYNIRTLHTENFDSLNAAALAYLETAPQRPIAACFAVAAPAGNERIAFTNAPWTFEISETKAALSLESLTVVNDFEALAAGAQLLKGSDLLSIKSGAPAPGAPVLVIGPGTGLGQALIVPDKNKPRIIPTEGGHVAFAPSTDEEIAVMRFLAREEAPVSVERLVSGPGIVNIYRALAAIDGAPCDAKRADEITAAAMAGGAALAERAVAMFCAVLGAAAGDAVLCTGAQGGVMLGGGVVPKIRPLFISSSFAERFTDKGPMRSYMEATPVDLIACEGAALTGAAAIFSQKSEP